MQKTPENKFQQIQWLVQYSIENIVFIILKKKKKNPQKNMPKNFQKILKNNLKFFPYTTNWCFDFSDIQVKNAHLLIKAVISSICFLSYFHN